MMRNRMLLLLLVICLLLSGCSGSSDRDIKSEYMDPGTIAQNEYRTTKVTRGDFQIDYQIDSKMTFRQGEFMYWKYSDDHYDELLVEREEIVTKGQVLATFETGVSEADILERELAVTEARASLSSLQSSYEARISAKQASLAGLEGTAYEIASMELEMLRNQYNEANASGWYRISVAQAALDRLRERKNNNSLIAPSDGIVMYTTRYFRSGDNVDTREPVVVVAEIATRAISFTNTNVYGNVPYMSHVNVIDQRTKKEFTGTVVSCAAVTGASEDEVWIEIDQELGDEDLIGAVRISGTILKKTDVLLIDSKALKKEGNQYYVLVLVGTSSVSKTYVKVGGQNAGSVWITEGLEEGQTLVIE